MRPRGEIRAALLQASLVLVDRYGGVTWRQLAQHACVGYELARVNVRRMVADGDLQIVGVRVEPHARRPMLLYAPAARSASAAAELASVIGNWGERAA